MEKGYVIYHNVGGNELFFNNKEKVCRNILQTATVFEDKEDAIEITQDRLGGCWNYPIQTYAEALKKHPIKKDVPTYGVL
jgi:hypothetical protein